MDNDLTIEKLKIHERLVALETRFDNINEKIDIIYKNIVGNGDIGLRTKVELLEQFDKERKESQSRLWTAMIATIFSFFGKLTWDLFKK